MRIIWSMTWKELLRKRVLLLTFVMTIVFLIGFWFIAGAISNEAITGENLESQIQKFKNGISILMIGFFFTNFVLSFLAIFSSFSAIAGETEKGVMQAMLPRPLPRWKWYVGRWLGHVSFGMVYALILFSIIIWVTAMHAPIPRDPVVWAQSFLLFAAVVPVLVTVSMFGSSYLPSIANGVILTMLYGASWVGGMIGKIIGGLDLEQKSSQVLHNIIGSLQLIMPTDALQRKMQSVLLGFEDIRGLIPMHTNGEIPSTTFLIYTACYTALFFWWGLRRFVRKDL